MIPKKAQIEKAVTFPVLILLIIILGAFLILASTIAIKSPIKTTKANEINFNPSDNSYFKTVNVKLPDDTEKRIQIYDALTLSIQRKVKSIDFQGELDETNNCYLLVDKESISVPISFKQVGNQRDENFYGYKYNPLGNPTKILSYIKYEDKLDEALFKTNDQIKKLYFYLGPC
jgi:hypothetical protein